MKAAFLIRQGEADDAFALRETPLPEPGPGQVRIAVEAFGLNFADIMARRGLYRDAPPLPAVLGYDVAGRIDALGEGVNPARQGERVTALTRFGGYAEYALTDARAAVPIPEEMDASLATALTTQAGTAYYMAELLIRLQPGERVLVQNAAGGVGSALVQLAKHRGCEVWGTAGSDRKLAYLRELGVDHPLNYRETPFAEAIRAADGDKPLDVIFDALGGKAVRDGLKLLRAGGRFVSYGASALTQPKSALGRLRVGLQFGFYHPGVLIGTSRSLLGVNMLRIADQRPEVLERTLQGTVAMAEAGVIRPQVAETFPIEQLGKAHAFLESRRAMGKVAVRWG